MRPFAVAALLSALLMVPAAAAKPRRAPSPQKLVLDYVAQRGDFKPVRFPIAHSGSSSRMQLNKACFTLRTQPKQEELTAFQQTLLQRAEATQDPGERSRLVFVLGRLGTVAALPLFVKLAREGVASAVEALALFGDRAFEDGYYRPGGSFPTAIFPASPDPRATETLLALWAARDVADGGMNYEQQARQQQVLHSLATHSGPAVEAAFAAALKEPGFRLTVLSTYWRGRRDAPVELVVPLLDSTEEDVPRMAAWVLGVSARREAIGPLIAHLDSTQENVAFASRRALSQLAGLDQQPAEAVALAGKPEEAAWWRERFGPAGERFDEASAKHPERRPPGIYDF